MPYLQIAVGFVLLFGGGEFLVRGAVSLARFLGVSPLLVGATVVAFGTSAPELAVAIKAQLTAHGDIAVGSVVGSNIANALLVLGATAVLRPVKWARRAICHDAGGLLFASTLFCVLAMTGALLTRLEGSLLLATLLALTAYNYVRERRAQRSPLTIELLEREATDMVDDVPLPKALFFVLTGLVAIFIGASQLVDGAAVVARMFGISEATIGLTIVAIGTSLPELAACCIAACRCHGDVALGNVIGSNVFNMLGIAGVAGAIAPLEVPAQIASTDIWIMFAVMAALSGMLLLATRVGRVAGALMILAYGLWIATLAGSVA